MAERSYWEGFKARNEASRDKLRNSFFGQISGLSTLADYIVGDQNVQAGEAIVAPVQGVTNIVKQAPKLVQMGHTSHIFPGGLRAPVWLRDFRRSIPSKYQRELFDQHVLDLETVGKSTTKPREKWFKTLNYWTDWLSKYKNRVPAKLQNNSVEQMAQKRSINSLISPQNPLVERWIPSGGGGYYRKLPDGTIQTYRNYLQDLGAQIKKSGGKLNYLNFFK